MGVATGPLTSGIGLTDSSVLKRAQGMERMCGGRKGVEEHAGMASEDLDDSCQAYIWKCTCLNP